MDPATEALLLAVAKAVVDAYLAYKSDSKAQAAADLHTIIDECAKVPALLETTEGAHDALEENAVDARFPK